MFKICIVCLLLLVSCAAPVVQETPVQENLTDFSASAEINESLGWMEKAHESGKQVVEEIKNNDLDSAKSLLSELPVYADEAERVLQKAVTSVESEKEEIVLLKTYVSFLREYDNSIAGLLDSTVMNSNLSMTENLIESRTFHASTHNKVKSAIKSLETASTTLKSIDLEKASSRLRVLVNKQQASLSEINGMLNCSDAFLSGYKLFMDGMERFTKIDVAHKLNNTEDLFEHIYRSRDLLLEANAKFNDASLCEFPEVSASAMAINNIATHFLVASESFEEGIKAFNRGDVEAGKKFFDEGEKEIMSAG